MENGKCIKGASTTLASPPAHQGPPDELREAPSYAFYGDWSTAKPAPYPHKRNDNRHSGYSNENRLIGLGTYQLRHAHDKTFRRHRKRRAEIVDQHPCRQRALAEEDEKTRSPPDVDDVRHSIQRHEQKKRQALRKENETHGIYVADRRNPD